ncbi:MAG TPA: response regulator [Candidatus Hydrogenedentes bacterium]|nr:response regulator [Candidatus Hydrogenedentota bacterium]
MAKPRILVVDDEETIRDTLYYWFNERGFEVDSAFDGLDAVEKCRQNHYDAITMDLNMPRMTGAEATTVIKQSRPDLPIILFTGTPMDWEGVKLEGAAMVLTKPLQLRDLEGEIRRLIDGHEANEAKNKE